MEEKSSKDTNFSKAYRLFVAELNLDIKEAHDILCTGKIPGTSLRKALGEKFHKLKGGAGFFQLHEIFHLARELEAHLRDESENKLDNFKEMQTLICALEKAAAAIPEAALSEEGGYSGA